MAQAEINPRPSLPAQPWAQEADGLLAELDTTRSGLSGAEAGARQAKFGPNELPSSRAR
jgi:hypothetical protein